RVLNLPCYVNILNLSSIPTRRSSDLPRQSPEGNSVKKIGFLSFGHWSPSPQSGTRSASDALLQSIDLAVASEELGADGAYFRVRSEEHTSELQSREKLVCRLLLEKKK